MDSTLVLVPMLMLHRVFGECCCYYCRETVEPRDVDCCCSRGGVILLATLVPLGVCRNAPVNVTYFDVTVFIDSLALHV